MSDKDGRLMGYRERSGTLIKSKGHMYHGEDAIERRTNNSGLIVDRQGRVHSSTPGRSIEESMEIVPRGRLDRKEPEKQVAIPMATKGMIRRRDEKRESSRVWTNESERKERLAKIKSAGAKVAKFVWGLGNQVPYDRRTGERLVEHPDRAMLGQDRAVIATSHRRTPLLTIHGSGGYGAYQGELGTPSEPLHGSLGEPTGDPFSIGGSNQSTFDWSLGGSSQKSSRRSRRGQQPQQDSTWDIRL